MEVQIGKSGQNTSHYKMDCPSRSAQLLTSMDILQSSDKITIVMTPSIQNVYLCWNSTYNPCDLATVEWGKLCKKAVIHFVQRFGLFPLSYTTKTRKTFCCCCCGGGGCCSSCCCCSDNLGSLSTSWTCRPGARGFAMNPVKNLSNPTINSWESFFGTAISPRYNTNKLIVLARSFPILPQRSNQRTTWRIYAGLIYVRIKSFQYAQHWCLGR